MTAEIPRCSNPRPAAAFELQWFGQAAFKTTTDQGKVMVIDAFISKNPKTPENLKSPAGLGKVELILVTHGHGDDVGDTAELAKMTGAKVAIDAVMGHTFGTLGLVPYDRLIRFNKSGPIKPLDGITVTMVRAEHSSEVVHTDPASNEKRVFPGAEPCGYIVELENGFKVYHAGDTGVFAAMAFIGAYYQQDLTLLPIGGRFTMDPAHAAYAIKNLLKSKRVIPMDYATFPPSTGTPDQLNQALGSSRSELIVMQPGDKRNF